MLIRAHKVSNDWLIVTITVIADFETAEGWSAIHLLRYWQLDERDTLLLEHVFLYLGGDSPYISFFNLTIMKLQGFLGKVVADVLEVVMDIATKVSPRLMGTLQLLLRR